jgi:hypothetical protein
MFPVPLRALPYLVVLLIGVALGLGPAIAKCISLQLTLKGEIDGATKDSKVVVEIASATHGDSVTEVRQESSIKESHFRVVGWFNTTSNVVSAETCDRRPHLVTVKLAEGEQILDQQTLTVETDFRRTKAGDYELKKPIVLHHPPSVAH